MSAKEQIEIIFTEGSPPAAAPPRPVVSDDATRPASPLSLSPDAGPQSLPPGPVARPSTAAGPPATPSASTLTPVEAAELMGKFGLKPEQIGARVAGGEPPPGGMSDSEAAANFRHEQGAGARARRTDPDLEARLAHQDEMHDILSPDEPDKPAKPPRDAGPKAKDKPGILAMVGKQSAQAAAAEAGGAVAGAPGAAGAGALAAESIAALGPIAAVVGGFAIAIGGAVVATKAYVDALSAGAQSIRHLSPDVAGANAENEVGQTFAMLRRADEVGPQLGGFQRDMGKLDEAMADVWTEILKVLTKIYDDNKDIMEGVTTGVKIVGEVVPVVGEQIDVLMALLGGEFGRAMDEAREILPAQLAALQRIKKLLEGEKEEEPDFDPLEVMRDLQRIAGLEPAVAGRGAIRRAEFGPRGRGVARGARRLPGRGGFGA